MLPSYLLALREGIEAALVIGIVLGALRKIGRQDLKSMVWRGVLIAVIASILAAGVLDFLGTEFEGPAEELFEGGTMLLAAGLLTWMIFWMRRQSRSLKQELENSVSLAIQQVGGKALFALAFLSVAREGLELSLFLAAARFAAGTLQTVAGAILGLATAALLGWALFATTRRLNLQTFFKVTNVLLILFSAGLVAQSVREFNEAGIIPEGIKQVWNLTPVLSDQSTLGEIFKTLLGYSATPSLTQVLAYLAYLGILVAVLISFQSRAFKKSEA